MRPLDVILPVAGAADDFRRCVESLLDVGGLFGHRLVVVLDGPQDEAVLAVVARLSSAPALALEVLENPERRGYPASVNRGMALSERDVVLLNSDTIVTAGWLGKLQAAAESAPRVATVTPFSNNATICSLPEWLVENELPAGHSAASFGRLVEAASQRSYPRLPTGVGFCIYIRRQALDEVGPFDEAAFGVGYGEEVDFCRRALNRGFVHLLDDATFIYHAGHRSFGKGRLRRIALADRLLQRRHPSYVPDVARLVREDPLRPLRERVVRSLAPRQVTSERERILHIVHGWPPYNYAGTEGYARSLVLHQAASREVSVLSRIGDCARRSGEAVELFDGGARVTLVVNNFDQRNPLTRNALYDPLLEIRSARLLDRVRPTLVHLHHLAGHTLALASQLARRNVPFVFHLHDWWLACARANLLDHERRACTGPGFTKCARCSPMTHLRPARVYSTLLHAGRRVLSERALNHAAALIFGSRAAAESLGMMMNLPGERTHLVPYGIDLHPPTSGEREPAAGRPLRFGVIGSLQPHKGIHVAIAAFRGLAAERATLEVWGDPAVDPGYTAELGTLASAAPVTFRGRFAEAAKGDTLAALDALIVPSIGLESFGLVAHEAIACGTPVVLSPVGALAELAAKLPSEASFRAGDAAHLRARIEALLARPETLAAWSRQLPAVPTFAEHAAGIEAVYARVLAGRRRP